MEITIIRHGKSLNNTKARMSASGFGQWIDSYNHSGIDTRYAPSSHALAQAGTCATVVCSHLCRSIESARALGVLSIDVQDALFRECDMPYTHWKYPKLSVSGWSLLFRVLQMFGYSSNAESLKEAKLRAKRCALQLGQLANENGSVLFVGHGFLNWLIVRQLLRQGWVGPRHAGREHWSYGIYRYPTIE